MRQRSIKFRQDSKILNLKDLSKTHENSSTNEIHKIVYKDNSEGVGNPIDS